MSEANNQVKISIFGQEYSVKAPADPDYIKKIAQYLDEKMREVQLVFQYSVVYQNCHTCWYEYN